MAARNGHKSIVEYLIDPKKEINCNIFLDNNDNWSPIEITQHEVIQQVF